MAKSKNKSKSKVKNKVNPEIAKSNSKGDVVKNSTAKISSGSIKSQEKKSTKNKAEKPKLARKLSLTVAISLVVGNIIGSGIFNLPSGLAKVASPKVVMLSWFFVSLGMFFIVMSYARLSTRFQKTGGPVVYAENAYGRFGGFSMAWIWWITSAIGNAAIVSLLVTNISKVLTLAFKNDVLDTNLEVRFIFTLLLIGIVTLINYVGVKSAGIVSLATTILKTAVLGSFIAISVFFFNFANFNTQAIEKTQVGYSVVTPSHFGMMIAAVAFMYWAYTGIESSTLASEEIVDPKKNIYKSTIYGFGIAAFIYLLVSFLIMGVLTQGELATTATPFPDAFAKMLGSSFMGINDFWNIFISIAISISLLGALSGWFLTTARCIYSPAEQGYFFKKMAQISPRFKTPSVALLVSSAVTITFVIANYFAVKANPELNREFVNIITVAAILNLPTYLMTTIAELIITMRENKKPELKLLIHIGIAIFFSVVFILIGIFSGLTVSWINWAVGLGLVLSGLPLYPVFNKRNN